MTIDFKNKFHIVSVLNIVIMGVLSFFLLKPDNTSLSVKFGFIDSDKLKNEAIPFNDVKNKIDNEIENIRKEFIPHSTALETEFENLKKEKNTSKAKEKKEKFEKKKAYVDALFLKKQNYLQNLQNVLSQKLNDLVLETIQKIAKKKKLQMIINKYIDEKLVVLHADQALDLTEDVILQINKKKDLVAVSEEDLKSNDQ
ncbi:MAG: hypothetical protein C0432_00495 [Candidatus Puniceispirillum sp.]|nr:hypothetical protein [Candidatus Pelagibacter sp.]MBA4282761.1 hypothetical protein [Candidatus Puniceispirillum sp.]